MRRKWRIYGNSDMNVGDKRKMFTPVSKRNQHSSDCRGQKKRFCNNWTLNITLPPCCKFRNYSGEFFANLLAVSYTKGRWCYWLLLCEKDMLWCKLPYHSSPFQRRKEHK